MPQIKHWISSLMLCMCMCLFPVLHPLFLALVSTYHWEKPQNPWDYVNKTGFQIPPRTTQVICISLDSSHSKLGQWTLGYYPHCLHIQVFDSYLFFFMFRMRVKTIWWKWFIYKGAQSHMHGILQYTSLAPTNFSVTVYSLLF